MQQLATASRPGWGELDAFARLHPDSARPIAVAVSGGGDSLAALIHTCAWAKAARRPVLALSVDHGLQGGSAAWTAFAGEAALRLGARFQALAWTGDKPAAGLAAAARAARHALLADAARAAGCAVIVTGHTADDQAENGALGQGALREWSPSPAWPEGRGVFLLRPLLDRGRADIRRQLRAAGWTWVDDPANEDLRHPRARVRAAGVAPAVAAPLAAGPEPLSRGGLQLARQGLGARAIAIAAVSAGGGARLPRAEQAAAIANRIAAGECFRATLSGARIVAGETVAFVRELGRGGLETLPLPVGEPVVWDGRYVLVAYRPGLTVGPLAGAAAKLSKPERVALRRMEAWARPALPVVFGSDERPFCPVFAGDNGVRAYCLVTGRYRAACHLIADEQAVCDDSCMANDVPASYVWA